MAHKVKDLLRKKEEVVIEKPKEDKDEFGRDEQGRLFLISKKKKN